MMVLRKPLPDADLSEKRTGKPAMFALSSLLALPNIAWRPDRGKRGREPHLSRGLSSWSMGRGDCRSDAQALNFNAA
jgi:hypothetical protein